MSYLLANTINVLNEKGVKYKVTQEATGLAMAFGIIAEGKKTKVEVIPGEAEIAVKGIGAEKSLNEEGFGTFLDTVVELRAIQEKEAKLLESLKA